MSSSGVIRADFLEEADAELGPAGWMGRTGMGEQRGSVGELVGLRASPEDNRIGADVPSLAFPAPSLSALIPDSSHLYFQAEAKPEVHAVIRTIGQLLPRVVLCTVLSIPTVISVRWLVLLVPLFPQ